VRLIQEQEDKLKQQKDVEVERMQEGLHNLSMQERRVPIPKEVREDVLHSNSLKDPQQCEVPLIG
jgi:hypothetical protein